MKDSYTHLIEQKKEYIRKMLAEMDRMKVLFAWE